MQCECGGDMLPRKAVWRHLTLEYLVCRGCGRVGGEAFYRGEAFEAAGPEARRRFNKEKAGLMLGS